MFEKFGEFDSCEEINMAAQGLYEEGDTKSLDVLAKENGLEDMLEIYLTQTPDDITSGEVWLCDPISAAIGKLKVEQKEASNWSFLADDVVGYLAGNCDDEVFARAVRKKGKRIEKAAALVAEESKKHKVIIPGGGGTCNYCGPMQGYQIIKKYYQEA